MEFGTTPANLVTMRLSPPKNDFSSTLSMIHNWFVYRCIIFSLGFSIFINGCKKTAPQLHLFTENVQGQALIFRFALENKSFKNAENILPVLLRRNGIVWILDFANYKHS